MPINPNWTRWIVASVTKHFSDAISIPLYIEGTDRRTDRLEDYAEFRYNGPRFNELSKGYFEVELDVDILVRSKINDKNIYTPEIGVGAVLAAFVPDIGVFQYGTDSNIQVGCLSLASDKGEVVVTNFGLIQEQVRLRTASVEATYCMNISN